MAKTDSATSMTSLGTFVVPILGAHVSNNTGIVAHGNVAVQPIQEFRDHFGEWPEFKASDNEVLAQASHCFVLSNVAIEQANDGPLIVGDSAAEQLACLFNALTLETPGPVTFVESAILVPSSEAGAKSVAAYVAVRRDFAERIDSVTRFTGYSSYEVGEAELRRVLKNAEKLLRASGNLRVAANRLSLALQRVDNDDLIVDLCVGIEALLGTGRDEIVTRISLRSAAILAASGNASAQVIYKGVRDLYAYRSQVVHGSPGPYKQVELTVDGQMIHAARFAVWVLSELLRVFLSEDLRTSDVDARYVFSAFDRAGEESRANAVEPAATEE